LANLKWLDLSFNMITKIEGLDKCLSLTDLSLFKNRITVLSGLENLKELNVLSVGSNMIISLDNTVDYLKKLKNKLEVLRISDNAFQK
jgi:Leucine-rich repeat (LRR) protein